MNASWRRAFATARHLSAGIHRRRGRRKAILRRVPDPPRPSWLYSAIAVLSRPIVKIVFRLRATGLENVPAHGGFVLAANHLSNLDPWPLGLPLFPRRYLRFMAKSELFWFPLGPMITAGGAFPVHRGESDAQAVETAVALCRQGHAVVMFPEGTRRKKGLRKKHEARWHSGAARIALEARVPLVPAAISGTDRLARLAALRVAYGSPIDLADLDGSGVGDAAATATARLREAVESLESSKS
jgi:1-acyl-sn-glycerol-3-phosphate acyltransferase